MCCPKLFSYSRKSPLFILTSENQYAWRLWMFQLGTNQTVIDVKVYMTIHSHSKQCNGRKEFHSPGKCVCTEHCVLCLRNISAHASNALNRFDNSMKDKTKCVFHSLFTAVVAVTVKYMICDIHHCCLIWENVTVAEVDKIPATSLNCLFCISCNSWWT